MSGNSLVRWFDPAEQAASLKSLASECVQLAKTQATEPAPPAPKPFAMWGALIGGGGAILFLTFIIVMLMLSGGPKEPPRYFILIPLVILLPAACAGFGYWFCKRKDQAESERFETTIGIKNVSPQLTALHEKPVTTVSIPVVFDYDGNGTTLGCFTGAHNGKAMSWINRGHTYDSQGPDGSILNRESRITGRRFDAILFHQRLPYLPDLFVTPGHDLFCLYIPKEISPNAEIVSFREAKAQAIVASEKVIPIYDRKPLVDFFAANRNLFLQVTGGCILIHADAFGLSAKNQFRSEEQFKGFLDASTQIYGMLEKLNHHLGQRKQKKQA